MLIIAGIISGVLGDVVNAILVNTILVNTILVNTIAILAIVILNAVIGFYQKFSDDSGINV
jgi:magnesium-transporting ATPase (P-type)